MGANLLTAVDATLAVLDQVDIDRAAHELARAYARQLDQSAVVAARADKALRLAEQDGAEALVELVSALRAKLGERECFGRLGPELHKLLESLGATPKARGGARPAPPAAGALSKLRAVR